MKTIIETIKTIAITAIVLLTNCLGVGHVTFLISEIVSFAFLFY